MLPALRSQMPPRLISKLLPTKIMIFLLHLHLSQAQEQLTCIACDEGHYLNPEGNCQLCPQNSFTAPDVNASSVNNCLCEAGYTNSSSVSCQPCPLHSFKGVLSNITCSLCPQHSVTLDTGNTVIEDCYCDQGFQLNLSTDECEACASGTFKTHIADFTPEGPVTYTLQVISGQYTLDGVFSPALTLYRGIETIIEWPSSHPLLVTADDSRSGGPFSGAIVNFIEYYTSITIPEDYQGDLNYFCQHHPHMGFNAFTIASRVPSEAPCDTCPENFYCPTQSVNPIACPADSTSLAGSKDIYACHCAIGFYAEFSVIADSTTLACHPCPTGTFNNQTNQLECTACPQDTYNPSSGSSDISACQACDPNSDSPVGSTSIESCSCRAGYAGEPGDACVSCPSGFYRSNLSEYICTACPINTYNVLDASTSVGACVSCPENTASLSGSRSPDACVCDPGFYATATANSGPWICTPCAAGSFSITSNSSTCELCQAGTYSTAVQATSAQVCVQCANGSFSLQPASTACTLCPFSTWQHVGIADYTSQQCEPCPDNSYHTINGSVDVNDCTCAAGYYKPAHLLSTYSFTCQLCPGGDECPGDDTRNDCPINFYAEPGSASCTECAQNSQGIVSLGLVSEEQCQCIEGFQGAYNNLCTECPTGTFQDLDYTYDSTNTALRQGIETQVSTLGFSNVLAVNVTCKACPADTYCDILGSPICFACPSDSSSTEGSDELSDCTCNPGFYGPPGGACTQCPPDHFCEGSLPEPNPCHAHTFSQAGSTSSLQCKCVPGYYSTENGGTCLKCIPGSYCSGGTVIRSCSQNSTSSAGASTTEQCICEPGQWRGCILLQDGSGTAKNADGQDCIIDYSQPCYDCSENVICLNNTLIHCPEHSVAPAGSHDADACTCVDGFFNQHI